MYYQAYRWRSFTFRRRISQIYIRLTYVQYEIPNGEFNSKDVKKCRLVMDNFHSPICERKNKTLSEVRTLIPHTSTNNFLSTGKRIFNTCPQLSSYKKLSKTNNGLLKYLTKFYCIYNSTNSMTKETACKILVNRTKHTL